MSLSYTKFRGILKGSAYLLRTSAENDRISDEKTDQDPHDHIYHILARNANIALTIP